MNIEHISVSRKTTWETCQQQYKFKYHLKIKSDGPEPFFFTYGKIFHAIAEHYVAGRGNVTLESITNNVMQGNIPLEEGNAEEGKAPVFAPPLQGEYKGKLQKHLLALKKLTDKIGFDGICEHKFKYDLDPPNNKFVTGFIDRLINKNGKFFIIDYKTTKKSNWRKNNKTIIDDLQLRCYARVIQKEFNAKAENIMAALFYLEGEELVPARFSEESLINAEKELLDAYNQIVDMPPEQAHGTVDRHCRWCDYRPICPYYSLT